MTLVELHPQYAYMHETPNGEAYTTGSSNIVMATVASVVALVVAIAFFVIAVQRPPVTAATATAVYTHIAHTIGSQQDTNGDALPAQSYDQVFVMTNVQLRNQSDKPVIVRDMVTNVTLPDGPRASMAITATDYDRVFRVYPELAKYKSQTINRDTVLQPGQTITGMLISAFHVSDEDWSQRKDLNVTLHLQSHPDVVITPGAEPQVI